MTVGVKTVSFPMRQFVFAAALFLQPYLVYLPYLPHVVAVV